MMFMESLFLEDVGKSEVEIYIIHFKSHGGKIAREYGGEPPRQVGINREVLVGDKFGAYINAPVELFDVGREIIRSIGLEFGLGRVGAHVAVLGFAIEIAPDKERGKHTAFHRPSFTGAESGLQGYCEVLVVDFGYYIACVDAFDVAPVVEQLDGIVLDGGIGLHAFGLETYA